MHLSQLWQSRVELETLNVQTKVVTFDADFMARAYVKSLEMKWPLLLDPEQQLYDAYGMTSGAETRENGQSTRMSDLLDEWR